MYLSTEKKMDIFILVKYVEFANRKLEYNLI
jgi:hypothetical protein